DADIAVWAPPVNAQN
nr:RecName: Full=Ribonuclease [Thelephora ganbajun]